MSLIFALFRASPFAPLQAHFATAHAAAQALEGLMQAAWVGDWSRAQGQVQLIVALEEQADTQKRTLRAQLPKGVFLPVSRSDLLQTLQEQDAIANLARDIARLVYGRRLQLPESLQAPTLDLLRRSIATVNEARTAVNELDELVEVGFRGRRVARMQGLIERIEALESESDWLELELRDMLFAKEGMLNPVDVIFIYRLFDWLGDLADHAEAISHRLQLMVAR